jgi:hypothetical protein
MPLPPTGMAGRRRGKWVAAAGRPVRELPAARVCCVGCCVAHLWASLHQPHDTAQSPEKSHNRGATVTRKKLSAALKIRCPQGRVGSSPTSGIAENRGFTLKRNRPPEALGRPVLRNVLRRALKKGFYRGWGGRQPRPSFSNATRSFSMARWRIRVTVPGHTPRRRAVSACRSPSKWLISTS